ncbi:hypothetical protein HYW74_03840 [Candidatus Pacearchaeota archaeon]|nr:hypothetical protein [Candidatus Pacearchaeota archaeon]
MNESQENREKIPKKKNVFLMFILSLITIIVYPHAWYIKRANELNNLRTAAKFNKAIPIISLTLYLALITLVIVLAIFTPITSQGISAIDWSDIPIEFTINISLIVIISIALVLICLIMAFKTRKILNEVLINKGEKVKVSGFFTLIFNFLYLQYEMNRIINDKENNKRKGPWAIFILIILIIIASIVTIITLVPDFLDRLFPSG